MQIILLYFLVVLLQTALIHYQHFSPFERESNLRAVLWGAKPAPRYWAVLALDILTGLLLALLVLSVLPASPRDEPSARALRFIPVWITVSLGTAILHYYLSSTIIRFPNYGLIARRLVVAMGIGIVVVAATLFLVSTAMTADSVSAVDMWLRLVPEAILPALLIASVVCALRALAFMLRVLPVIGSFLHAATTTLLLVWAIEQYGRLLVENSPAGPIWKLRGLEGIESIVFTLGAFALALLILAWRLEPAKHADAVEPPSLVISKPEAIMPAITITDADATATSANMRVQVTRAPFRIVITNASGETLWQLAENGLARDWLLHKIVSIPLLHTGNTMKMKWRVASESINRVTRIQKENDTLAISFPSAMMRLSFHNADILRVTVGATKQSPRRFNALSLTFREPRGMHILGLGQRFNKIDQRGEEVYFFVEEGGVGYEWTKKRAPFLYPLLKRWFGAHGSFPNGEQCTGFPVPFALLARERGATTGLFWNTYKPSWFNADSVARLTVLDDQIDLYLCAGPTPLDAIRQYTALTGRSDTPPPWVFLPWKTRTGPVTENDAYEDIREFHKRGIPLAHVGIEHWQEIRGSYEFSKQWYPHIDSLVKFAHDNGMRITIWHFPYMNAGAATHREGVQRGYFLSNRLGLPYQQRIFHGIATVIDYTNPHAAAWHESIVKKAFYERGFQGAMTDYAESVPPDCVCYNGRSGLEMRNAYPVMYCASMQRAAREVLGDDHLLYPRAGYAGSQRFVTAQWPGDQDTDWDDGDGLPAAVRAMLNVSMCGFPIHGSDIGGWYDWYAPITTKELFIRWAEVGAYSPLMRTHGGPIGRNREPWKFDEETVEIYRALSEEHVRLFPYWYSLAKQATRDGTPIIRHPALMWSNCAELYEIEDTWMIGDALYVAPVIRQGQTQREVFLPPGEWWDMQANRAVGGLSKIVVNALLGRTPTFLRRGFVVPRFVKVFDTFNDVTTARVGHLDGDIEAWIYPGETEASFTLFDGTILREGEARAGTRNVEWRFFD